MAKSDDSREFKINFSPEEIVNKDFKQKYRGYDVAEVDPFLDQVIQDYEAFRSRIKTLEQENQRLVTKVDELSRHGESTPNANNFVTTGPSVTANTTNYDILRRISNLERHVFGEKEAAKIANKPAASSAAQPSDYLNINNNQGSTINRF